MAIYIVIGIAVAFFFLIIITNIGGESLYRKFIDMNENGRHWLLNAEEFARVVNEKEFDSRLEIKPNGGILTDAFALDSPTGSIYLSESTIYNNSSGALAIAAHEFGHAKQFYTNPNKLVSFFKKNILSRRIAPSMLPLVIIGIILLFVLPESLYIGLIVIGLGILVFLICLFVKLSLIPIEKEASSIGLKLIMKYVNIPDDEVKTIKKFYSTALMSYIADFLKLALYWTGLVKKPNL